MSVSAGHVIWAYERHIYDLHCEGKTVTEIQRIAREEWRCNWGRQSIKDVLRTYPDNERGQ